MTVGASIAAGENKTPPETSGYLYDTWYIEENKFISFPLDN